VAKVVLFETESKKNSSYSMLARILLKSTSYV
jgi:hypothetical protein